MSRPENPLAQYRSYSYHHILMVCDTDAAAEWLSDPDRGVSVFRDIGSAQSIQTDPEVVDDQNPTTAETERLEIGNYVVILNELVDTSFRVRELQFFSATAASTDVQDRFNSIAVEGSMEVQEPRGIRFLNAMNNAADLLKSDPTGLTFLLKTVFVGHTDNVDGSTSTTYITNIRPLRFILYNVTGTFDTTGGNYLLEFAGISNGASRLPQYSRAAEQVKFKALPKLKDTLTEFARRMSEQSTDNRECLVKALVETYGQDDLNDLRSVEYEIEVEPPYDSDDYLVDRLDARQTDQLEKGATPTLVFTPGTTVEQAIRSIMDRCSQVIKDRDEGEGEDKPKYIYKIQSQITMDGVEGTQTTNSPRNYGKVVVKYFIRRFAQVKNEVVADILNQDGNQIDEGEINALNIKQNLIEFDYFFTGLNTDIIDFDLKMEMGLAFLQVLSTANTLPTQAEEVNRRTVRNSSVVVGQETLKPQPAEDGESVTVIRTRTPIFPATKVKDILLRNAGNPMSSAVFQAYLARHAALESLEASVVIHGNPNLMNQTNRQANERARENAQDDEAARAEYVMENWDTIPALAKVNIFMPSNSDTPSTDDTFRKERFWYDGYYYIYAIQHKFSEGEFTQELSMLSLPNKSLIEEQNKEDFLERCGEQPENSGEESGDAENNSNSRTTTENEASVPSAGEASAATGRTNDTEVEELSP